MRPANRPWDNVPASATVRACADAAAVRRGSTLTGGNPCVARYCEMRAAAVAASDVLVETWLEANRRAGSCSAHCVRRVRPRNVTSRLVLQLCFSLTAVVG